MKKYVVTFFEIFKGLQPLFPARIDVTSDEKSKKVVTAKLIFTKMNSRNLPAKI